MIRELKGGLPIARIARSYSVGMSNEFVLTSKPASGVRLLTLNRPKELNALNASVMRELNAALFAADRDESIGAIIITGGDRAFAAGADIKEMKEYTTATMLSSNYISHWSDIRRVRKPIISVVRGYALGGGCELAMSADILFAGESARFGQPEIQLGVIPGAGGTQRLVRAIGKAKAMDLVLSSKQFTAQQAEAWGLAAAVHPDAEVLDAAVKTASKIASFSRTAISAAKQAINESFEMPLTAGLLFERNLFYGMFSTADQKEGMDAFVNKRKPEFNK